MGFDIDKYLNPLVPRPHYERWPRSISHFFGYRPPSHAAKPLNDLLLWSWILVSSFAGMVAIMVTFNYGHKFVQREVPVIVPSWAASAILMFNAVESPLGQPRNAFFGTMISSLIGVCLMKLFMTNEANEKFLWVCGALAVGVSSSVMRATKCVHPPAGAAALLPAVDTGIRALGWYYLLVQLLSAALIIAVACIFNNVQRRYPMYWWTPAELPSRKPKDVEKAAPPKEDEVPSPYIRRDSTDTVIHQKAIYISVDRIHIPEDVVLSNEEREAIENLQLQLSQPTI